MVAVDKHTQKDDSIKHTQEMIQASMCKRWVNQRDLERKKGKRRQCMHYYGSQRVGKVEEGQDLKCIEGKMRHSMHFYQCRRQAYAHTTGMLT